MVGEATTGEEMVSGAPTRPATLTPWVTGCCSSAKLRIASCIVPNRLAAASRSDCSGVTSSVTTLAR